ETNGRVHDALKETRLHVSLDAVRDSGTPRCRHEGGKRGFHWRSHGGLAADRDVALGVVVIADATERGAVALGVVVRGAAEAEAVALGVVIADATERRAVALGVVVR